MAVSKKRAPAGGPRARRVRSRGPVKRREASGRTGKRFSRTARAPREYLTKDMEDLLIEDLVLGIPHYSDKGPMLAAAVYNATGSMRELGYNHGFSVGKEVSRISGGRGILHLLNVLDNAGIGRMLYMPVSEVVVIKGSTRHAHNIQSGRKLHGYEAGLISGYLSAYASRTIRTEETHCRNDGAEFCQFVSNDPDLQAEEGREPGIDETTGNIAAMINDSEGRVEGKAQSYMLLSLLPIIREPVLKESSKLMFLAGKRLAESNRGLDAAESLKRLASFFDIQHLRSGRSRKGFSVTLRYNSYNSMYGFVELSTKAFIGFLSKRYNSVVRLSEGRQGNSYTVTLSVKEGA